MKLYLLPLLLLSINTFSQVAVSTKKLHGNVYRVSVTIDAPNSYIIGPTIPELRNDFKADGKLATLSLSSGDSLVVISDLKAKGKHQSVVYHRPVYFRQEHINKFHDKDGNTVKINGKYRMDTSYSQKEDYEYIAEKHYLNKITLQQKIKLYRNYTKEPLTGFITVFVSYQAGIKKNSNSFSVNLATNVATPLP